jgi:hypothetical protein
MQTSEFQQWTEESKIELESLSLMKWSKEFDFIKWVSKMLVVQESKWEHNNISKKPCVVDTLLIGNKFLDTN